MSNPIPLDSGRHYHIYNRGNFFVEQRNFRPFLRLYVRHTSPYHAHLSKKPTRVEHPDVPAWSDGAEGFKIAHRDAADTRA